MDANLVRKAQFRAALTMAGLTMLEFAASQGVTYEHMSYVLAGKRESARLTGEIDAFIAKHTPAHAAA